MLKKYHSSSTKETEKIGYGLAKTLDENNIKSAFVAMFGEMGVGKTAFTRGFCSYFGIESVMSPTYTVLNEYRGRALVHHFDFYRITDEDDLYSIGFTDVTESEGYSIGEWSENIESSLPENAVRVTISRTDFSLDAESDRTVEILIPSL